MNESVLEAWVGKYVTVMEAPLVERRPQLTGSIEAVGADGLHLAAKGGTTPVPRSTPEEVFPLAHGAPRRSALLARLRRVGR